MLRDDTGEVVAALGIAALASRMPRNREVGVVRAACAAAAISHRLAEVAG